MAKPRLPNPKKEKSAGKKISEKATAGVDKGVSDDDLNPSFRFTHVDEKKYVLSKWSANEISDLMNALKKIENHTWSQIKSQGSTAKGESVGCGFKLINPCQKLPESVSKDAKISEMRVCKRKRIFGFRLGSIYYIIWFDRDHSVCPE